MPRIHHLFLILLVVLAAAAAQAQQSPGGAAGNTENANVDRFQRQLDQFTQNSTTSANAQIPISRRALFDYGAYLTLSYLSADDPGGNNHGLREADLVGYAHVDVDGVHEFFGRGRVSYLNYNPGDGFTGRDYDTVAIVEMAYYQFDLQRALSGFAGIKTSNNIIFKGGRQLVYWANGLSLSQTLDGVLIDASTGPFTLEAIAGITPARTVDFDTSRPFYYEHTLRGFYGVLASMNIADQRPYAYALYQADYTHGDTIRSQITTGGTINGVPSQRTIVTRFHYDSYYLGIGSSGNIGDHLHYGVEAVHEGGRGRSNSFGVSVGAFGGGVIPIPQTTDAISANAFDAHIDYLFNNATRTRLSGEFTVASGDGDRLRTNTTIGGNAAGTHDNAFNGFGLINTGLAFAPTVSNVYILRTGASLFPLPSASDFRNLQIGGDLFFYGKPDVGGAIDQESGRGWFLGTEPDLFANWQIRSDLTLAVRYGAFFPYGPSIDYHAVRQFFYAGLTIAF